MHRWFVEYNPLYLLSAMLVLAGSSLVSRGLAGQGNLYGPMAVAALAELYAGSLIAGAALLMRNGQRRSAVMLAMLAVAYQGDLTLHTETSAVLGVAGMIATTIWFTSFVLKLVLLARAMRIRVAPRAFAAAALGGAGVALSPYLLSHASASFGGLVLAALLAALLALLPRRLEDSAASREELDDWGRVVLRRALRVTWFAWAALLSVHVLFWINRGPIDMVPSLAALIVVPLVRRAREQRLWGVVVASALLVAFVAPARFSSLALLLAFALWARVLAYRSANVAVAAESTPYRTPGIDAGISRATVEISAAERLRLLTGALVLGYLGAFTLGWRGGAWPAHALGLDALFLVASLLLAWRCGARLVLVFVTAMLGHALTASGLVPVPRSHLEWGALALGSGFVLLFGSLAISHRARVRAPTLGQ